MFYTGVFFMVTMVFELLQRTIGLSRNGCGQFQHLQHFNHIGIFCSFLFMDFIRFLSIQPPSQRRNQRFYASFSTQTLFPILSRNIPNIISHYKNYSPFFSQTSRYFFTLFDTFRFSTLYFLFASIAFISMIFYFRSTHPWNYEFRFGIAVEQLHLRNIGIPID